MFEPPSRGFAIVGRRMRMQWRQSKTAARGLQALATLTFLNGNAVRPLRHAARSGR